MQHTPTAATRKPLRTECTICKLTVMLNVAGIPALTKLWKLHATMIKIKTSLESGNGTPKLKNLSVSALFIFYRIARPWLIVNYSNWFWLLEFILYPGLGVRLLSPLSGGSDTVWVGCKASKNERKKSSLLYWHQKIYPTLDYQCNKVNTVLPWLNPGPYIQALCNF